MGQRFVHWVGQALPWRQPWSFSSLGGTRRKGLTIFVEKQDFWFGSCDKNGDRIYYAKCTPLYKTFCGRRTNVMQRAEVLEPFVVPFVDYVEAKYYLHGWIYRFSEIMNDGSVSHRLQARWRELTIRATVPGYDKTRLPLDLQSFYEPKVPKTGLQKLDWDLEVVSIPLYVSSKNGPAHCIKFHFQIDWVATRGHTGYRHWILDTRYLIHPPPSEQLIKFWSVSRPVYNSLDLCLLMGLQYLMLCFASFFQ